MEFRCGYSQDSAIRCFKAATFMPWIVNIDKGITSVAAQMSAAVLGKMRTHTHMYCGSNKIMTLKSYKCLKMKSLLEGDKLKCMCIITMSLCMPAFNGDQELLNHSTSQYHHSSQWSGGFSYAYQGTIIRHEP